MSRLNIGGLRRHYHAWERESSNAKATAHRRAAARTALSVLEAVAAELRAQGASPFPTLDPAPREETP